MAVEVSVDDVARALYASVGLFLRRFRQVPTGDGLTLPERSALARLDRAGPATAADLARAEQITPQAVGATLGGLAARGLVRRDPDLADGRRAIVSITEAGVELLRHKRDVRAQQLAKLLAEGFTPEELAVLRAAAPLIERLGERL